jgi:hypothetical protein
MDEMFKKIKKLNNIRLNDVDNIINDMLNDDKFVKKYTRQNIIKYTTILKNEINKNVFGLAYIKARIETIKTQNKMNMFINSGITEITKTNNPLQKINFDFLIKNVSSSLLTISKDLVLFFFTICIVAHLRMRTFIKSCYLYPSNPNRFPYVFYNKDVKEQLSILSITDIQTDSDTEPVFKNIKTFSSHSGDANVSLGKNSRINNMCGDNDNVKNDEKDILETAAKLLLGDNKNGENSNEPSSSNIENIIQQITGTTFSERLEKINPSSKAFMEEHREKCKDELSIYSLITYLMYYNTLTNRETIGYLHNNLFKYVTSSGSRIKFGVISILFYSIFKNNVHIAERFSNNILDYYSDKYDGGGKIHSLFTGILSSVLTPFVTFSLMLLMILYPLSIFNCMKSYFNYVGLTNQFSTKIVCYIGMIYSIFALTLYSIGLMTAIFPEFLAYMLNELRFMTKNVNGSKKKGKGKKGKGKEGFNGEKGCSGGDGFFNNFNIAKLFGVALLSILGLFALLPVVMPFVCAFMSSFGVASSLTFDSLKFMNNNMCSIKQYSSLIVMLVSLIFIHQIINRYSYGAQRNKWITVIIYIVVLTIYLGVEALIQPTDKYFKETCEKSI